MFKNIYIYVTTDNKYMCLCACLSFFYGQQLILLNINYFVIFQRWPMLKRRMTIPGKETVLRPQTKRRTVIGMGAYGE